MTDVGREVIVRLRCFSVLGRGLFLVERRRASFINMDDFNLEQIDLELWHDKEYGFFGSRIYDSKIRDFLNRKDF